MHSKRLLCIVNVLPLCPPFNLTAFQQQYCISPPPPPALIFVLVLGGPVGLALFLKAQKTHFPPSLEGLSISAYLSAQSLLVVSDVPRAFSAHFKRYNLFPR